MPFLKRPADAAALLVTSAAGPWSLVRTHGRSSTNAPGDYTVHLDHDTQGVEVAVPGAVSWSSIAPHEWSPGTNDQYQLVHSWPCEAKTNSPIVQVAPGTSVIDLGPIMQAGSLPPGFLVADPPSDDTPLANWAFNIYASLNILPAVGTFGNYAWPAIPGFARDDPYIPLATLTQRGFIGLPAPNRGGHVWELETWHVSNLSLLRLGADRYPPSPAWTSLFPHVQRANSAGQPVNTPNFEQAAAFTLRLFLALPKGP